MATLNQLPGNTSIPTMAEMNAAIAAIPQGGGTNPTSLAKVTTDQVISVTTLVNIAGLSFNVTAGRHYHFKFVVLFRSGTATVGIKLAAILPGVSRFGAQAQAIIAADGPSAVFHGAMTASADAVISTAVPAINTDYVAIVEGILVPSANGVLQLQGAAEAAGTVTVRQGSSGFLTDLGV